MSRSWGKTSLIDNLTFLRKHGQNLMDFLLGAEIKNVERFFMRVAHFSIQIRWTGSFNKSHDIRANIRTRIYVLNLGWINGSEFNSGWFWKKSVNWTAEWRCLDVGFKADNHLFTSTARKSNYIIIVGTIGNPESITVVTKSFRIASGSTASKFPVFTRYTI